MTREPEDNQGKYQESNRRRMTREQQQQPVRSYCKHPDAETQRSCSGLCRGPGPSDDCEYFQHEQPPAPGGDALLDFVRLVETKNREMAALMRRNKIKISDLEDPMQKLAFTFYTEIGELAHKAGVLLAEHEAALPRGEQHE